MAILFFPAFSSCDTKPLFYFFNIIKGKKKWRVVFLIEDLAYVFQFRTMKIFVCIIYEYNRGFLGCVVYCLKLQ